MDDNEGCLIVLFFLVAGIVIGGGVMAGHYQDRSATEAMDDKRKRVNNVRAEMNVPLLPDSTCPFCLSEVGQ